MVDQWEEVWVTDDEEDGDTYWDQEGGNYVIKFDKGGTEQLSRVDLAVSTTCTTLADTVDEALESRDFRGVYKLIEVGHSVNQIVTDNGSSILHRAAKYGCIGFTQNLIKLGAKVNNCRLDGVTPLILAAQGGHEKIVKLLTKAGADLNVNVGGYTPIYLAAQQGHEKVVRDLLIGGADPNICITSTGLTPLHTACFSGHINIVKMLLSKGANCDIRAKDGATPLIFATAHADTTIRKLLERELCTKKEVLHYEDKLNV